MKRTIEIDDNLSEIIDDCKYGLKELVVSFLDDNKDIEEAPDLFNDIDYDGSFHELIDSSVPIYTGEIEDLFYLYGNDFENAFDNAGIGDKDDKCWPMGWKAAAIYCYLEQEIAEWYEEEKDDIYNNWLEEYLIKEIKRWDHEDINDLNDLLIRLNDTEYDFNSYHPNGIDISDLPSELIPDTVNTSYPIWSMDKKGFCLVGKSMDIIEHINEIMAWYKSQEDDE